MVTGSSWQRTSLVIGATGLVALIVVAFAACGGDDNGSDNGNGAATVPASEAPDGGQATTSAGGEIDYGALSGSIRVDGSSTVYPISEAVAEEFQSASDVRINVAFSGTGGGFERFCRGEIQISNASRPIEEDEVQACAAAGIEDIVELQVAIDALTVMVNSNNEFAECMTVEQLHQVFTGQATQWSDVDASWPSEDIELFFPGTDSGTFDYFVEAVIEGIDENAQHTGDGTPSEDDNVLAQGIAGDSNALGYFGFAYFQEAGQSLRAVAIDGGEGCVEPSLEAALDGSYQPLSRPLFIYTRESLLQNNPEVLGFVKFYLDNSEVLVQDVGYVPMPEELLGDQLAKIEPYLP